MKRTLLPLLALCLLPASLHAQAQCVRQSKSAPYVCTFPVDSVLRVDTLRLTDTVEVTVRDTVWCLVTAGALACGPDRPVEPTPPPRDTVVVPPEQPPEKPPEPPDTTTPKPPPPTGATCPNEPTAWKLVSDRSFVPIANGQTFPSGKELDAGWASQGAFAMVQDPTAPDGDGWVGQEWHNAGSAAGRATMSSWLLPDHAFRGQGVRNFYVCYWIKPDPTWSGNQAKTSKQVWLTMGTQRSENRFFTNMSGAFNDPLEAVLSFQGLPGVNAFDLASGLALPRGQWSQWELKIRIDAGGVLTPEMWVNGQPARWKLRGGPDPLSFRWTGSVAMFFPSEVAEVASLLINNTYGGSGAAVPHNQWIRLDRFRARVSP